jgi:hypothetical protein
MDIQDVEWVVDGHALACATAFTHANGKTLVSFPMEIELEGDAYWSDRQLIEAERRYRAERGA